MFTVKIENGRLSRFDIYSIKIIPKKDTIPKEMKINNFPEVKKKLEFCIRVLSLIGIEVLNLVDCINRI